MGVKNWLVDKLLVSKISKIKKISPVEKSIDEMMVEEMKTMTSTNRTIDKMLKVKLMRQESQNTLSKIQNLDNELEEEEEGEEVGGIEEQITQALINKFMGNTPPIASGDGISHNDDLEAKAASMGASPEQIKQWKEKMGLNL